MADTNMTLPEKLVLSSLIVCARYNNDYPSISCALVKNIYGMASKQFDKAIEGLVELGYIKAEEIEYENGNYGYEFKFLEAVDKDFPGSIKVEKKRNIYHLEMPWSSRNEG